MVIFQCLAPGSATVANHLRTARPASFEAVFRKYVK